MIQRMKNALIDAAFAADGKSKTLRRLLYGAYTILHDVTYRGGR